MPRRGNRDEHCFCSAQLGSPRSRSLPRLIAREFGSISFPPFDSDDGDLNDMKSFGVNFTRAAQSHFSSAPRNCRPIKDTQKRMLYLLFSSSTRFAKRGGKLSPITAKGCSGIAEGPRFRQSRGRPLLLTSSGRAVFTSRGNSKQQVG